MEPNPASESVPPPTASPQRPWTILGRVSKAVREQNWFAVVLELAIVVLGVVIGFQVTAWGQARSDRVKEVTYLRQLSADLRETERNIQEARDWLSPFEEAAGALQRAFFEPDRLPADSLVAIIGATGGYEIISVVSGTSEALVSTGDISLIRNDSLRSAITAYPQKVERYRDNESMNTDLQQEAYQALRLGYDRAKEWDQYIENEYWGGLSVEDPMYPLPDGARRRAPPLDAEAFLSDPAKQAAAFENLRIHLNLRGAREELLNATVDLREQVEAELNR